MKQAAVLSIAIICTIASPGALADQIIYVDPGALKALDASMQKMDELKMVVSAIILVPRGHAMSHPDCAPQGIYAMANVVEEEGWNVYAAGLDFLAQRYTRPGAISRIGAPSRRMERICTGEVWVRSSRPSPK